MPAIEVRPLQDDLPFGAQVTGVTREALGDEDVRAQIRAAFEDRGILVFKDMEPSGELQVELSHVFGPPMDHAMSGVKRADDTVPGVIELNFHPGDTEVMEVNGALLSGWLSWHYDACYTKELYRGAVLRALDIPPEGGLTGFADGVQMYKAISPELRERFETLDIVYHPGNMLMNQRFGLPDKFRILKLSEAMAKLMAAAEGQPRGVHPAIWTRAGGEKVLHVSPWQAAGIHGMETPEGDALLEALCQEMYVKMTPYWHKWSPGDMLVWDNWRTIHAVSGHKPEYKRRVHRATVRGDYGLGRFDGEPRAGAALAMMG
jgi:taurine dioxygenase